MTPIKSDCFVVTRLRQIRASLLLIDIAQMPDGVREHERLVNLAEQHYGLLIAEASHGTIAAPCGLTAQLEFLRTGEPVHSIRVQSHVSLLTLTSFAK